ncbi:MAG: TetR/AcrR family transcriptional regulator [Chloroflexi bacterium]|nr:TetR/AcrR family transcriptional regulator [Chloroflexota bacterium]
MSCDNRANILHHALRLFAARGYDAVGVQEIVEAAGVTKPTLYHYFGSKRGLLDALLTGYFEPLHRLIWPAAEYRGDLPLTLTQIAAAYFRFARENPAFYRMQLSMYFAPPESDSFQAVIRLREKQHHLLENLFLCAAEQHGNMKGRQQRYAITFQGMIDTYIGLSLNGYTTLNNETLYQAIHQFMHGIFS